MAKATQKYQVKEERKSFLTANIESNLHRHITQEAARNKLSFSTQIMDYISQNVQLQEQVDELMTNNKYITEQLHESREEVKFLAAKISELKEEIKKITDVN